jgi:restriction system protein
VNNPCLRAALWVLLFALIALAGIYLLRKRHRCRPLFVDEMEGHDFEFYCADMLKESGFEEVEVTRGSHDFGADILAKKDGVTYAVQCKCYTMPVGVSAVQEVYAGKDYYDCMVGVVLTNQYFTKPAQELAEKLNILLWDRDFFE